jgi:lipopolysaccharide transport system permease protein
VIGRIVAIGGEFGRLVHRQRRLAWAMAVREISDRFAGSALGMVWALAHPLFLMALFVVVFTWVFGIRFPNGGTGVQYSIFIIAGYLPWMTLQDVSVKSCTAITGNANLVKQVVFPLEVLPLKSVLASLLPQAIGLAFLAIYTLLTQGSLPWTYALLPLALLVEILGLFGMAFLLSSLTPYVRDIKEVMTLHAMAGLYLLPILYVPNMLPSWANVVLFLNPFSHPIWMFQDILSHGYIAHPWSWGITIAESGAMFLLGYVLFRKVKVFFGNVL